MKNKNRLIFKYAQGKKVALPKNSFISILKHSFNKHNNRLAVVSRSGEVSYLALDLKSNAIAALLQAQSIIKGDVVLVEMKNSIELLISLIAILKLGAIYVPIDPDWPLSRKKEIKKITKSKIILVNIQQKYQKNKNYLNLTIDYQALPDCKKNFITPMSSKDALYGFFTSGSTGIPKCALNSQVGLINRLVYMNHRYGRSTNDVILLNSKNIFDASLWQMLWPLTNGATLVIPHNNENFVPTELIKLIDKYKVTITDFVPSIFSYFIKYLEKNKNINQLKSLRQLLIGGEEINVKDVAFFKDNFSHVGITNTYGPTECSIGTIFYEVISSSFVSIPIGRPIDNVSAIILKKNMQPVDIGEVGEIYLGGVCVGLGYLRNKRKTNKVFLKNNFKELSGSILYKTGDFGRYLPSGDIQYKGRLDQQVKIDGVRVELGEIENKLKNIPSVDRTVVYFENVGNKKKELFAVISIKNKKINEKNIRMWCQKNLPFNLVPNHIKIVDDFPLTSTGKINRKMIKDLLSK